MKDTPQPTHIALPDLEQFYDALAEHIDQVGPDKAQLFLAKLALLLASEVREPAKLANALSVASHDL